MTLRTKFTITLLLSACCLHAAAMDLSGTWKYDKAADALNGARTPPPIKNTTLQFVGNQVGMGSNCFAQFRSAEFNYPSVFRAMLEANQEEKELASFLKKNFAFNFDAKTDFFMLTKPPVCRDKFGSGLVDGDRLIVPYAGQIAYSFVRSNGGVAADAAKDPRYFGHLPSQLPFRMDSYLSLCADKLAAKGKLLDRPASCAPVYQPYAARKSSTNKLDQIIGNHDYKKPGASHADEYAPPFASGLQPVYLIMPAMKDVLLVRVDDFEAGTNEQRDVMSGVWLAIKNGQVTDQFNEGCDFDESYVCSLDGKKAYQLTEAGKFRQLPR